MLGRTDIRSQARQIDANVCLFLGFFVVVFCCFFIQFNVPFKIISLILRRANR